MSDADNQYALEVRWDETAMPGLPRFIGPFDTMSDVEDFIRTSVINGVARVRMMSYPWARAER